MVVEVDRGSYSGTSTTFAQLCDRWLMLAKSDLSPVTVRNYKNLLKNHIIPSFGDIPVKDIKTVDIDNLYYELQKRKHLTSSTVRHVHSVIRRAFRQATTWGWIASNPAMNATQPRFVKPNISIPSTQQVLDILRAAYDLNPELGHFFHLAATSGARRGELCALRWPNVDLIKGTIFIEHAIIEAAGGVYEKDTKTHASRRVKLDPDTVEVLEAQYEIARERAAVIGIKVDRDAFVFSHEPDGALPFRPDYVTKRFADLRDRLGYYDLHLHGFRHYGATRLIDAGLSVRAVSGRLGHANASTTLSVYTHFLESSDDDAAMVMGGLVKRQGPKKPVPKKRPASKAKPIKALQRPVKKISK
jgi:integrase